MRKQWVHISSKNVIPFYDWYAVKGINDCHRAKADGRRRRPLFVRNINMLNGNKVTIITPRSAHLPQVVQFHYQGRARFYVRHVFASIAVALHMLGLGEAPSKRGARAEGANC